MERTFLERLAQPRPDPGGGAAAAHVGALGVALLEKVVGLEVRRDAQDQADYWQEALKEVRRFSSTFEALQEKDCAAYLNLAKRRASSASDDQISSAIQEAVACPSETIQTAKLALASISGVGARCKKHLAADLQVACELMGAAIMGSYHIATANLRLLQDQSSMIRLQLALSAQLDSALKQLEKVREELVLRTRPPARNP